MLQNREMFIKNFVLGIWKEDPTADEQFGIDALFRKHSRTPPGHFDDTFSYRSCTARPTYTPSSKPLIRHDISRNTVTISCPRVLSTHDEYGCGCAWKVSGTDRSDASDPFEAYTNPGTKTLTITNVPANIDDLQFACSISNVHDETGPPSLFVSVLIYFQ